MFEGVTDELRAVAREEFPVGSRVRWNAKALTEFRRKLGQSRGVVTDHDAWFAKELGKPNVGVKIWWDGESFSSFAHPCWIEKII